MAWLIFEAFIIVAVCACLGGFIAFALLWPGTRVDPKVGPFTRTKRDE